MFGKQIAELQLRKKTLLLESNLNRLRLRAEANRLRDAMSLSGYVKRLREHAGPLTLAPAVIAGLIFALGRRRPGALGGFLVKTLAAAPTLLRFWNTLRRRYWDAKQED